MAEIRTWGPSERSSQLSTYDIACTDGERCAMKKEKDVLTTAMATHESAQPSGNPALESKDGPTEPRILNLLERQPKKPVQARTTPKGIPSFLAAARVGSLGK